MNTTLVSNADSREGACREKQLSRGRKDRTEKHNILGTKWDRWGEKERGNKSIPYEEFSLGSLDLR